MLTGIDINEMVEFTSEYDRGDPKTVFKLGVIPTVVLALVKDSSRVIVMDMANPDGKTPIKTNIGQMQLQYVRYGLKGWSNFKDGKGKDIDFRFSSIEHAGVPVQVVSDESLNAIPDDVMMELSARIQLMNSLTESEVKNLDSPSV